MPILKVYSWSRLVSNKTNRFLCPGLSILEFQTCIEFKVHSILTYSIYENTKYNAKVSQCILDIYSLLKLIKCLLYNKGLMPIGNLICQINFSID